MHTGEYRGFVGQFSGWLHGQVATWRGPLLFSLCLHALFFWPKSLQESGFGTASVFVPSIVQARLQPSLPAPSKLPEVASEAQSEASPRALVTQSSSRAERSTPAVSRDEVTPVEALRQVMLPTAGLDAGAVRAYRIAWARALIRSGLRERLDAEVQGRLEVGVAVAASGQITDIALLKGSGVAALDHAVIAAMRNAMPSVALPPVMQGREFVLVLPVEVGAAATAAADR